MIRNLEISSDPRPNERTFLAWVRRHRRNGFGFLVEKFDLFMELAAQVAHSVVARAEIGNMRGHWRLSFSALADGRDIDRCSLCANRKNIDAKTCAGKRIANRHRVAGAESCWAFWAALIFICRTPL